MSDAAAASPRAKFLALFKSSLAEKTFVKLTLSDPKKNAENGLKNIYARTIELRAGRKLSLLYRYSTKDVTKNFAIDEGIKHAAGFVGAPFEHAHLFTTAGDWHLRSLSGAREKLARKEPSFTIPALELHDRAKKTPHPNDTFLRELGVVNAAGAPIPGKADKLRQIERFVEILGHLVERAWLPQSRPLQVVDLACGKGYLTFATHQFLRARGIEAQVTGVEQRRELVEQNESISRRLGFDGLSFVEGTIANLPRGQDVHLLLALHACDTATDEALHFGVQANAQLILASPCCHKELRPQIVSPPVLHACFRHGILAERQAELLTDAIRALLLEIHGYEANVFEFISNEHTAKNLMISAIKRRRSGNPSELRSRLHELFRFFGLREQRLARLLAE